jgi:hypothetical protein
MVLNGEALTFNVYSLSRGTGYIQTGRPRNLCLIPGGGKKFSLHRVQTGSETSTSSNLVSTGFFPVVKKLGCKGDHSYLVLKFEMQLFTFSSARNQFSMDIFIYRRTILTSCQFEYQRSRNYSVI